MLCNIFSRYVYTFLQQCRQHGMEMSEPSGCEYIHRSKQQDIEPLVMKAKNSGATFIHFVTADELNYHGYYFLKYLEHSGFKSFNKQICFNSIS